MKTRPFSIKYCNITRTVLKSWNFDQKYIQRSRLWLIVFLEFGIHSKSSFLCSVKLFNKFSNVLSSWNVFSFAYWQCFFFLNIINNFRLCANNNIREIRLDFVFKCDVPKMLDILPTSEYKAQSILNLK